MSKQRLFDAVDARADDLRATARAIWETPELGLREEASAARLRDLLADRGFEVTSGVGGMPTAFVAEYGAGDPRIGLLGEYDALPGLSQRVAAEPDPVEPDAPGHGCGHNLFGTAAAGAALAVAAAVDAGDVDGTVRFYGCPAEETLVGKVYMARAGVFDDLDAALTWHPSDFTRVKRGSALAMDSLRFAFEGEAAHAASAPEAGRSALDAVQLLDTGVEYLREHVPDGVRVHYALTAGGDAPNVVPAAAEGWYYVRAPDRAQVERVTEWLRDVAAGAARMTRTRVRERFVTGCYDILSNQALGDVLQRNLDAAGAVPFDEADRAFAADLQATLDPDRVESALASLPPADRERAAGRALHPEPVAPTDVERVASSSGDNGDVSYLAPMAQFYAATWPVGTPAHSWQAVAASGDLALAAVPYVARVLAGATYDLMADPALVRAAREEFESATAGRPYECPLPPDAEPPFDLVA
jgi:aminobenzoyl-glutamate utilization protein B